MYTPLPPAPPVSTLSTLIIVGGVTVLFLLFLRFETFFRKHTPFFFTTEEDIRRQQERDQREEERKIKEAERIEREWYEDLRHEPLAKWTTTPSNKDLCKVDMGLEVPEGSNREERRRLKKIIKKRVS